MATRSKAEWRRRIAADRAGVPPERRATEAEALVAAVRELVSGGTVCCYLPFGTEPGSAGLPAAARAAGARVLLPVVPAEPGPLDWAEFTGPESLRPGRLAGLHEPGGARLGPAAIGMAGLVLVPALAVDHQGVRLGRGAGFYDRSLPLAAREAGLVAIVRDQELVPMLPAEPHDVLMTCVLTPSGGVRRLPV